LKGENPSKVIKGIHAAVNDLNHNILPKGVKIVPYIDRSELVHATVHTVGDTLLYGMGLVTLVLLFFLGSVRAALIVAITIPIALVIAFICMYNFNIPANLLSLGAIDFGIIVDGAIVVTENILRRREEKKQAILSEADVLTATLQVTQPIFFGILVIITAYSVLFAFQDIEYKLFAPMAFAVGFALIGALLAALFLIPGLAFRAYHNPVHIYHNPFLTWLKPRYGEALEYLIGRTKLLFILYFSTLVFVVILGSYIGRDFLPYLDEGSLWLQVTLPPGISLDKASAMADELRAATLKSPEVSHIVSQLGRNDDGTDPFMPSHVECAVTLQPYKAWPAGMNKQKLIATLSERYEKLAGMHVAFTQPMIDGVLDKVAGAHSDLVVKIYGNDMVEMRQIATNIVQVLKQVHGAQDVIIDQEPPMTELRVEVDRHAIARLGINIADVMDLIQTGIGGEGISQIYLQERFYDLTVRFPKEYRSNPEEIGRLLMTSSTGALVSLSKLAKIYYALGQTTVTHEMMHRQLIVRLNLRGRDLLSFTKEANQQIAEKVPYNHTDYQVVMGGQLENQQRAQARFKVIIPMLLGLMFILLFAQFGNLRHPG
ncbi:MAG: efflux RND transporter permease subunit, partial [Gammaproteobacteria bacterium]|nr:efflux RND transporter permease subunit [Gammaproteobacteria bacterium]